MSQIFTTKMKQPNIVVLNGLVDRVQPLQAQDARRWQLYNYQRGAVLLGLQTDHEVYGGHHPVLVKSNQAAEIAATFAYCRSCQMPLAVTVMGWLYSRSDQSLTIASQVVCHISEDDRERVRRLLARNGVLPPDDPTQEATTSI